MTERPGATSGDFRDDRRSLLRYILQDLAVGREHDCLGGYEASLTLRDILRQLKRDDIFTGNVALFSPWGMGKTSVMSMLRDLLREDGNVIDCWFDAWRYDNKPVNMALGLVRKIARTLEQRGARTEPLEAYIQSFARMSANASELLLRASHERTALQDYCAWIDRVDDFRIGELELLRSVVGQQDIVVFIDDLDRCCPANVIFMLETLKNFMAAKNMVFVVAMDKQVVKEAVDCHYGHRHAFGGLYLEKVFPYEFYLQYEERYYHELIDRALAEFLSDEAYRARLKEIFEILPYNPRRLKAILRKIYFQSAHADERIHDYTSFLIIALAIYFPEFFDTICSLDERTVLNLLRALVIFRGLSEGLFDPKEREQQISKYPGMASFFNNDSLLDYLKLIDGHMRFRESSWSIRIRHHERPLKRLLASISI